MLGISYRKANPTDYALHFSRGKLVREGAGLSFWYFAPSSTIAPIVSRKIIPGMAGSGMGGRTTG